MNRFLRDSAIDRRTVEDASTSRRLTASGEYFRNLRPCRRLLASGYCGQSDWAVGNRRFGRVPRAFTLVEMLVVVAIIAMLAALVTGVAIRARSAAKDAVITMEIKQLEMALQAYKEKFGEYPPDFCDTGVGGTGRAIVLRHLSKIFPRFVIPGNDVDTQWANLQTTFIQPNWTNVNINNLTPSSALTFWLGGQPAWDNTNTIVTGFRGFSANPQNPFDNSASRINPFFDFKPSQTSYVSNQVMYYPIGVTTQNANNSYIYFRAENGNYTTDGAVLAANMSNSKRHTLASAVVWPALDVPNTTITTYTWINPKSFQIFSAGQDAAYSTPSADSSFYPSASGNIGPYEFPIGRNYDPAGNTFDDITNFSGGRLENAMP